MITFPDLLTGPAEEAGIPIPGDPEDFNKDDFPHFAVFCSAQLGSPMPRSISH